MINPNDSLEQQITDLLIDYEIINDKNAEFDEDGVHIDFDKNEFINDVEVIIKYQVKRILKKNGRKNNNNNQ